MKEKISYNMKTMESAKKNVLVKRKTRMLANKIGVTKHLQSELNSIREKK